MVNSKSDKYPFLNDRLAREAHVDEILSEIDTLQRNLLKNRSGELATVEYLNDSRNIKMPVTQKKLMNIQFLVDQLMKNHPDQIKPVYSFRFSIQPETKKLDIEEKVELTMLMNETTLHSLQSERDSSSTASLLQLLQSFRLFNLTKLIKKAKNKNQLSQIIKNQLGKTIFTFKNYSFDKSGVEIIEDYCFHRDNYDAVKNKIEIENLKKIVDSHSIIINRRLKNLGILNSFISDYRDSKIDYILSILTGELANVLDKKDTVAIKNFQSLRECINKVDKILDPIILIDADLINHIKSHFITTDREILRMFKDLTPEIYAKWENEKLNTASIIIHPGSDGIKYIMDPAQFYPKYDELMNLILYNPEFRSMEQRQKDEKINIADIQTEAGKKILTKSELAQKIFGSDENIAIFKKLAKDYEDYIKLSEEADEDDDTAGSASGKSFIAAIISSVVSLFTRGGRSSDKEKSKSSPQKITGRKKNISNETRNIFELISERKSPLIPLSELIEIKPENELAIGQIIKELRENELKIVVPIYNARQVLYPVRSRKYLIADVEYLLIDIETAKTPDTIREYIEKITGFKFREDVISGNALFSIEKYLFSIHRQNRAKRLREKK